LSKNDLQPIKISIMKNPKITVTKNRKGQWRFAQLAGNGESVLIPGETFKRKPTLKKLQKLATTFYECAHQGKVEFTPQIKSK
jgi:hypothetical protein